MPRAAGWAGVCVLLTPQWTTDDREEGHAREKFTFTNILANFLLISFAEPVTSRVVRRIGGWSGWPPSPVCSRRSWTGRGTQYAGLASWTSLRDLAGLCPRDSVHGVFPNIRMYYIGGWMLCDLDGPVSENR